MFRFSTRLQFTKHAKERYQERFGAEVTGAEREVWDSCCLGKRRARQMFQMTGKQFDDSMLYLVYEDRVFVAKFTNCKFNGERILLVITVMVYPWSERGKREAMEALEQST